MKMEKLEEMTWFPCKMHGIKKPEFLEIVRKVSDRYLEQARAVKQPMAVMTGGYHHEEELAPFSAYVSQSAWNILSSQGYAMDGLVTFFMEMWTQEHPRYSYMENHIHNMGAQISAFYFLDVPQDGNKLVLHDPRPARVATAIPQRDEKTLTEAATNIVLTPEPGLLLFLPAWLPHSFTRNESDEPCRFVHMNLSVMAAPQPEVEIV
jgi:uncharacterized protein (TIGR02466 family)